MPCPADVLCFHAEKLNEENGWEIKIHIDAASGGFIAPFQYPDLLWCARMSATALKSTRRTLHVTELRLSCRSAVLRLCLQTCSIETQPEVLLMQENPWP